MCWRVFLFSLRRRGTSNNLGPLPPQGGRGGRQAITQRHSLCRCAQWIKPRNPSGRSTGGRKRRQRRAAAPKSPALGAFVNTELTCVPHRSTAKECTQDGQGGIGPQETQGRTDFGSKDKLLSAAPTECTQDGQGGLGPQETQGRTKPINVDWTAPGSSTECTQEGQGGSGPKETQGCANINAASRTRIVAPTECTQEGQGGFGPQETQGCTKLDKAD